MRNFRYAVAYNPNIEHSREARTALCSMLMEYGISADVLDIDNLMTGYHFVFVIGNLIELRVNTGIKICSWRIIAHSLQRFINAVQLFVCTVMPMRFHIPLQERL